VPALRRRLGLEGNMTRDRRAATTTKQAKLRRDVALARNDFRYPSAAREPPAGVTSMPVKAVDAATRKMIDAALARINGR
jgi:hypothetical protein